MATYFSSFCEQCTRRILSHPFFQLENQQYSVYSNEKIDPMLALFSLMGVTLLLYIFKQKYSYKKRLKNQPY